MGVEVVGINRFGTKLQCLFGYFLRLFKFPSFFDIKTLIYLYNRRIEYNGLLVEDYC